MIEGQGGAIDLDHGLLLLRWAADQGHFWARLQLLALEGKNTSSILKKMAIKIKIARLVIDAVKILHEDEFSPKLEEING